MDILTMSIAIAVGIITFALTWFFIEVDAGALKFFGLFTTLLAVLWILAHIGWARPEPTTNAVEFVLALWGVGLILGSILPGRTPETHRLKRAHEEEIDCLAEKFDRILTRAFGVVHNSNDDVFVTSVKPLLDDIFKTRNIVLDHAAEAASRVDRRAMDRWLFSIPIMKSRQWQFDSCISCIAKPKLDGYIRSLDCVLDPGDQTLCGLIDALMRAIASGRKSPDGSVNLVDPDDLMPGGDLRRRFRAAAYDHALSLKGIKKESWISDNDFWPFLLQYTEKIRTARNLFKTMVAYCEALEAQATAAQPEEK